MMESFAKIAHDYNLYFPEKSSLKDGMSIGEMGNELITKYS